MTDCPGTLGGAIAIAISNDANKPFLLDESQTLSRSEFLQAVGLRQKQLEGHSISASKRVLVSSGRGVQYWVDLAAIWGLGAIVVPADHQIPSAEMAAMISIIRPAAAIGLDLEIVGQFDGLMIEDPPALDSQPKSVIMVDQAKPEDVGMIIFTSGSTGEPKGVVLTHRSLLGNAAAFIRDLDPRSSDRLFISIPYHFMSAICHFVAMALIGAEFYSTEKRPLFADLHDAIRRSGANCFGGGPIHLKWISDCAAGEKLALRWIMASGDHLSKDIIKSLFDHMPNVRVVTVYGLTELGARFCILNSNNADVHTGSVGRPIDGLHVKIIDENFQALPLGETGEIFASGAYLFNGYFENEEATAKAFFEDGMLTGDLGYIDTEGLLHVVGRRDDVFKRHGKKVSAVAVADALMKLSLFVDVAVIGLEDSIHGTVPSVFYVLAEGSIFDRTYVLRYLRNNLPRSHIPRSFTQLSSIPRTGSGKVKRTELRRISEKISAA